MPPAKPASATKATCRAASSACAASRRGSTSRARPSHRLRLRLHQLATLERSARTMPLQNFKVLSFDVVGTLIDFEGGMLAYLRRRVPEASVSDDAFLAAYRAVRKSKDADW